MVPKCKISNSLLCVVWIQVPRQATREVHISVPFFSKLRELLIGWEIPFQNISSSSISWKSNDVNSISARLVQNMLVKLVVRWKLVFMNIVHSLPPFPSVGRDSLLLWFPWSGPFSHNYPEEAPCNCGRNVSIFFSVWYGPIPEDILLLTRTLTALVLRL